MNYFTRELKIFILEIMELFYMCKKARLFLLKSKSFLIYK
ncbi:conserved hypothetical protein (plasmid) [Borreliella burgdorferi 64b]|nr:conserved hypothetical protein [Borreliella burgdorferi 64b]